MYKINDLYDLTHSQAKVIYQNMSILGKLKRN